MPYDVRDDRAIRAFLRRGLGTPEEPGNQDHLEGLVAEHLWHMAQTFLPADVPIVYLSRPKFDPTAPGADGLVVFGSTALRFRLWEIKKAGAQLASTISKAYRQLSTEGDVYLAQLTGIAQEQGRPELLPFFSQLVDLWLDGSPEAAAGVAVAISAAPTNCFGTMPTRLGNLGGAVPHRGLVVAIDDYPEFCRTVRTTLWLGL